MKIRATRLISLLLALTMCIALISQSAFAVEPPSTVEEDSPSTIDDSTATDTAADNSAADNSTIENDATDGDTSGDDETDNGIIENNTTDDGMAGDDEIDNNKSDASETGTDDEIVPPVTTIDELEDEDDASSEEEEEPTAAPTLTTEHVTYVKGKGSGQFDPNGSLTRAEAASMLSSLLASDEMGSYNTSFTDVASGEWYSFAVSLLASWGVINGYVSPSTGKTSFCPNNNITRAEFVTILCRLCSAEMVDTSTATNPFTDVSSSYWAISYILTAYKYGWINGYGDGTFRPSQTITRAEAVKIINAMIGRSASASATASLIESKGVSIFIDVSPSDWYYYDIMEASISHVPSTSSGTEVWTSVTYTSCGYSPGWIAIGSYIYYVNANGQFQAYASGVQNIGGTVYYVDSQGRIPLNVAGTYTVNGSTYYVTNDGKIPQTKGVYAISSTAAYILDGTGKVVSLSSGAQEYDGYLYYVNSDGTIALNTTVDYLYFGSDGAYTTGNSELDAMVETALVACVTSSMSQEDKLYAAYLYVRDNFTYLSRAHQSRGSTSWTEECAVFMFTYKKGNCYCFSSAFMYMARRLGFQAYPISGGVGTANSDHAWVMIPWSDGVTYMFDVELEYAYRYRYTTKKYYNLYKMTTSTAPFVYYFP